MSIETDIRTYLLTKSGVTNVCSTRIYCGHAPQSVAFPSIVISMSRKLHIRSMDGGEALAHSTIDIDCRAQSFVDMQSLQNAVRIVLDGKTGTLGSTDVSSALLQSEVYIVEPPLFATDKPIHRIVMGFDVFHEESVPTL